MTTFGESIVEESALVWVAPIYTYLSASSPALPAPFSALYSLAVVQTEILSSKFPLTRRRRS